MPFHIIRNDITKMTVDVIVNSANPKPIYDYGCDYAIYKAAGTQQLLTDRKKIGAIHVGDVAYTNAYDLNAKYIFHTVSPQHNEEDLLVSCYEKCLNLAIQLNCESIAFPLLATGNHHFPKDKALQIAIQTFTQFLFKHDLDIYLVVYDKTSYQLSNQLFNDIKSYIDEHYILEIPQRRYNQARYVELEECKASFPLENLFHEKEDTFQERLFQLIVQKELTDVEVYKKANIDRKLFSKIRSNKHYKPTKKTALALAIALELTYSETEDLLKRAELAFSPASKFDIIIEFFIKQHNYNIFEINTVLFEYDLPILN